MINGKDTKVVKELVISALYQACGDITKGSEIKPFVERAFDIVINEMKIGGIYYEEVERKEKEDGKN